MDDFVDELREGSSADYVQYMRQTRLDLVKTKRKIAKMTALLKELEKNVYDKAYEDYKDVLFQRVKQIDSDITKMVLFNDEDDKTISGFGLMFGDVAFEYLFTHRPIMKMYLRYNQYKNRGHVFLNSDWTISTNTNKEDVRDLNAFLSKHKDQLEKIIKDISLEEINDFDVYAKEHPEDAIEMLESRKRKRE